MKNDNQVAKVYSTTPDISITLVPPRRSIPKIIVSKRKKEEQQIPETIELQIQQSGDNLAFDPTKTLHRLCTRPEEDSEFLQGIKTRDALKGLKAVGEVGIIYETCYRLLKVPIRRVSVVLRERDNPVVWESTGYDFNWQGTQAKRRALSRLYQDLKLSKQKDGK